MLINTLDNTPVINWATCSPCSEWRSHNVTAGHWIDEGRADRWFRANAPGQPDGDKFVTRECDLVWPNGDVIRRAETGRLGDVCPREVPPLSMPSPPAPPSPSPGNAPPFTESGNYPRPEIGTCPPWFQNQPFSMHVKVQCKTKGNGGRRCTLDLTQRSEIPWMEHTCYDEEGRYARSNCKPVSEMWRGCQEPPVVDYIRDYPEDPNPGDGIIMTIYHPLWGYYGACDKITAPPQEGMLNPRENYRCQDSDDLGQRTPNTTHYQICMPSGAPCVEGTY